MPHQKCKTVYFYDELDDEAKDKARDWFRQDYPDYDWWGGTYDMIADAGKYLGIDLKQKPVKLMGGGTRYDPSIWFTGFYHQGSGSSFDGRWRAEDVQADKLKADFTSDKELHRLADTFAELAKDNPELSASITAKGDNWITVDVEHGETRDEIVNAFEYDSPEWKAETTKDDERADTLTDALRDFNRWIYKTLEAEYEYLTSDEQVAESIRTNEYEFTKDGSRA